MKKKLLALLLTCTMGMSLVACGSSKSEEAASQSSGGSSDALTVWTWDPAFNIRAMEIASR